MATCCTFAVGLGQQLAAVFDAASDWEEHDPVASDLDASDPDQKPSDHVATDLGWHAFDHAQVAFDLDCAFVVLISVVAVGIACLDLQMETVYPKAGEYYLGLWMSIYCLAGCQWVVQGRETEHSGCFDPLATTCHAASVDLIHWLVSHLHWVADSNHSCLSVVAAVVAWATDLVHVAVVVAGGTVVAAFVAAA